MQEGRFCTPIVFFCDFRVRRSRFCTPLCIIPAFGEQTGRFCTPNANELYDGGLTEHISSVKHSFQAYLGRGIHQSRARNGFLKLSGAVGAVGAPGMRFQGQSGVQEATGVAGN